MSFFILMFIPMLVFAEEDTSARSVAETVITRFACRSCHAIGPEGGGIVGPKLDQVTLRRSDAWLLDWLKQPSTVKSDTLMPKFDFAAGEREAMVAYLHQLATPVDAQKIFDTQGHGAAAGEALVKAYQCYSCHKVVNQPGRMLYPDLSTVKLRRNRKWEKLWLQDPQAVKPGTFMPTFGFTAAEISALVDFLYK